MSERAVFVEEYEPTGLGVAGSYIRQVGTVAAVLAAMKEISRLAEEFGRNTHMDEARALVAAESQFAELFGIEAMR